MHPARLLARVCVWSLFGALSALPASTAATETATSPEPSAPVLADAQPVPEPPPASATPLLRALRERRVVRFHYHGHVREVEPHALGVATGGEAVLHGYQIGGGSVSGGLPGWRTFTLAEIAELELTEVRVAAPRSDYAADRPKLSPLWAELAPAE